MKTRELALGYYEDINAEKLHYILETKDENGKWEHWLDFFADNSFYVDGVEIFIKESKTKTGQRILIFEYTLNGKEFVSPMFHDFTGRFALTKGALKNGLFHYNKPLSKLEQALVDRDISIRCVRYVNSELELDTIYTNIQNDDISPFFMKYLINLKIQPKKLLPKEYSHSTILPLTRETFDLMKSRGFMIIEKKTKESDKGSKSRLIPSIILVIKGRDYSHLINYIEQRYSVEK